MKRKAVMLREETAERIDQYVGQSLVVNGVSVYISNRSQFIEFILDNFVEENDRIKYTKQV